MPKDVAMEGEYQTMDYLGRDKGKAALTVSDSGWTRMVSRK